MAVGGLIGPVTNLGVLYGSIKLLDGSHLPGSTFFQKKKRPTFEIHRTSAATLANHAYGLYGISTSQSSVCKVN